jgi:hypothetical protein
MRGCTSRIVIHNCPHEDEWKKRHYGLGSMAGGEGALLRVDRRHSHKHDG